MARALGRGPPGLAHRVLGDGRGSSWGPTSRSTAAARTSCSPTTRTRSPRPRRPAASRWPGSGCTTACSSWATARRWPSRWATSTCCTRALDEYGRDALIVYFTSGHYRQPIAFSAERAEPRPQRAVDRMRELGRRLDPDGERARGPRRATPSASSTHLADDFNTPAARAVLFEWVGEANRRLDAGETVAASGALAEMLGVLGLENLLEDDAGDGPGRRGASGCWPSARRRARRATSTAPTSCATSWPTAAGWCATPPRARGSCAVDPLRAQPGARGAARQPARRPARLGHRGRAAVRGLAGRRAPSCTPPTPLDRASAPAVADHQGVCAEADAYPYADPSGLLAAEHALVIALDEVQDPHNLGAVCRVAESAGAAGVVIPERRSAEVTPAACKASAGAVEHLRGRAGAQPGRLAGGRPRSSRRLGVRRREPARRPSPTTQPDYRGRVVLVLGSEGQGLRPRVARRLRPAGRGCPQRGRVGSLNVSTAAAALVYGILHFREVAA